MNGEPVAAFSKGRKSERLETGLSGCMLDSAVIASNARRNKQPVAYLPNVDSAGREEKRRYFRPDGVAPRAVSSVQ